MEKVICPTCSADNSEKAKYCSSCGYELHKVHTENPVSTVPQSKPAKPDNKKLYASVIVGVATFCIAYFGVQQLFFKSGSIDKEIMNVASELNKSCPVMVDSETRLDNTVALPDNVFQYNYTLVNVEKSKLDTVNVKNYLEPNIINQVKTSPQMQYQRDHKWTLNYCYKDKNGQYILLIKITPDRYKN